MSAPRTARLDLPSAGVRERLVTRRRSARSSRAMMVDYTNYRTQVDRWDGSPYADLIMELHVPPELEAKLNRLAADTGRDVEQLVLDLLASSVEHDEWFRREVEKGRIAAREGRLLDRDELLSRIEQRYRA